MALLSFVDQKVLDFNLVFEGKNRAKKKQVTNKSGESFQTKKKRGGDFFKSLWKVKNAHPWL